MTDKRYEFGYYYPQHSCPFSNPALVNPPAAWQAAAQDSAVVPAGIFTSVLKVLVDNASLQVYQ